MLIMNLTIDFKSIIYVLLKIRLKSSNNNIHNRWGGFGDKLKHALFWIRAETINLDNWQKYFILKIH